MSKSLTPKEVMKKRIKNNKLLKLPKPETALRDTTSIIIKSKKYEKHNRELKDDGFPNPFALPNRMRIFTKELEPRKVQPLPKEDDDIRTVCDIHKEFFKVIEGRPLRQFDDIKVYMKNIRNMVDYKMNIGFYRDEIERIDHNLRQEIEEFMKVNKLCNMCRTNYVRFLKESFILARKTQVEAAKVADKLNYMEDQLEEYSFQYVRVRNQLGVVMGNYEKLLRYKNFLSSLAPYSWHVQFDSQSEHRVSKICANLNSDLDILSNIDRSDTSLTYLKPQIFFEEPEQLMSIFDTMCRQGQHYLAIVNNTSGILARVNKMKESLVLSVKQACGEMQDDVEKYENIVRIMKEKETETKAAFYKILFNDFKQLYSDYANVKLHTCVQYAHSVIFGESTDPSDKTIVLMSNLESLYMKLSSKMDFLDIDVVNAATKQFFAKDLKMMNDARNAHRQLQLSNLLEKALYTSFEPPRNKTRKSRV